MANKGEYLVGMGRYEEALPQLRETLRLRELDIGPENSSLAYILTNIGRALTSVSPTVWSTP